MESQIVAKKDKEILYEPDALSNYSITSGTNSYHSIKRPMNRCVHKRVQEEPAKYYKLKTVEDDVKLATEPKKPFLLDTVALEQIGALRMEKRSQQMRVKKPYQPEAYKRTAFHLMDEFFSQPNGQVFRLSGSTKEGRLTLQMSSVDSIRHKFEKLTDEAVEKQFNQLNLIDEEELRKARILALQKSK